MYLAGYNALQILLWLICGVSMLAAVMAERPTEAFARVNRLYRYVQSLMVLDVVHNLVGLTRGKPVMTALQISSRVFIVWTVTPLFDFTPMHAVMYMAWTLTELIRYSYYLLKDKDIHWLVWSRYSSFLILYPLGVFVGEVPLIVKAGLAAPTGSIRRILCSFALCTYLPGFPALFRYMLRQRRTALTRLRATSDTLASTGH
ncbi:Protein tyrosine phosphatase-like protein [Giardia muris]|uniref:very-long-chain (3R)-3-hydroxyacyl-CoA dehydratase n=1 Tax=Giardia muris TaxID=5742 RepID=A0A4Z1SPJ7_GIAMU|nr:Protein tyrosine phosphatase-like protein [Giardia muris]|eukprot:TNJ27570.1 Protein tyrosine phosphatase-like protein [Giardia muris]